jgi:hypothetical protein
LNITLEQIADDLAKIRADVDHILHGNGRAGISLHGGGSASPDPFAPWQGLPATHGCVRVNNYDLENRGRLASGDWPMDGHGSPLTRDRWLHSDFKNVALPFVYPLFQTIINRGALR